MKKKKTHTLPGEHLLPIEALCNVAKLAKLTHSFWVLSIKITAAFEAF